MYALLYALFKRQDFALFAKLNWLAILIDATDGTLARAVDIKKVVPTYDGALLDNIIDYQTFAVLPALAVIVFEIVPGSALQFIVAAMVLLSAAYQFCQTTAKTTEAFVGFPSYWNIVVFYIYYLECSMPVAVAVFTACAVLSFIPIHFIYPTRTIAFFNLNIIGAVIWATLMLFPTFFPKSQYARPALYASFVYAAYYLLVSLYLDSLRRIEERKA
ncbi:Phosphatidylcholine synthase [Chondrus crispus]|uniref:Phosphatidylcholine synthase n=1 Tax=Chondrus crispus TaxID=2769 RepID=R7Q3T4_CHOCR|nr:Phosphatidylcholine synthase [Chondrus crispus]CDF33197.1 Phosphatidylcholine synthase [Chondrus crispus]|eukprot:XP_005713000.1 Phosphatidylcholine synthase [Chondrus crispus]